MSHFHFSDKNDYSQSKRTKEKPDMPTVEEKKLKIALKETMHQNKELECRLLELKEMFVASERNNRSMDRIADNLLQKIQQLREKKWQKKKRRGIRIFEEEQNTKRSLSI